MNNVDPTLSDLFFNHEHPKRSELFESYADEGSSALPTEEEEMAAALSEATDFLEAYGSILPGTQPEDLAADFIRRC